MAPSSTGLPPLDELKFYIPFPDGTLHYDCPSCTAICCRGKGFAGSLKRELPELLRIYPALAMSVTARRGDVVSFANAPGGCTFLGDDNRCKIEERHGYEMKPGVCGLFPFNNFSRIAPEIIVIGPHFLCPLQVVTPAQPGRAFGSHNTMREMALASGLIDSGSFSRKRPPIFESGEHANAVLHREERFRDGCGRSLGKTSFREFLLRETGDERLLVSWLHRAAASIGVELSTEARDILDDTMLVLASGWRLQLLKMTEQDILRVLLLAEAMMRRAMFAQPITPQQIMRYFEQIRPMLVVLARGDEALPVAMNRLLAPNISDPALGAISLRVLAEASRSGLLTALEMHVPENVSLADRMALLMDFGGQFA